jgi:periplasmic protein TonB
MPQERTRLYPAAAIALVAEVLLLGGAFVLLTHKAPAPVELPPTMLTLAAPPAPTPPAPKPVVPTPPQPRTPPPVRPVVPAHHVVTHTPPKPAVVPPQPVPTPAPAVPSAAPTESAPRPAPETPPPPALPATASPSFEGALRAAIQAALHYPESARMAGMSGRTCVAFRYRDGVVSNVSVVVSSGMGLLDRAAVAAVRDAAYPKPEPAFVGKPLSEQLWVTFNLDDHD